MTKDIGQLHVRAYRVVQPVPRARQPSLSGEHGVVCSLSDSARDQPNRLAGSMGGRTRTLRLTVRMRSLYFVVLMYHVAGNSVVTAWTMGLDWFGSYFPAPAHWVCPRQDHSLLIHVGRTTAERHVLCFS